MSKVTPQRRDFYQEEVDRNSAVSEALKKKIASSVNFINENQLVRQEWKLNGYYASALAFPGFDGMLIFPVNSEIVYISISNAISGSSGTTQFDIEWFNASGSNQGSIFATRPSLNSSSPNDAYQLKRVSDNTNIVNSVGGVQPIMSKTSFDAGNALKIKLTSSMAAARDAQITVHYRPI